MTDMEQLLTRLSPTTGPDAKGYYRAHCPFHDDQHPSFFFHPEKGFQCFGCQARGSMTELAQRLGLLRPDSRDHVLRRIVKTYDYTDADGTLLFQVVRYAPKDFRQRRPDGQGGWIWNLDGVKRVLYRLPELLQADPQELVFVVEGEKDADALAKLGLVATTNPHGVNHWCDEYSATLQGRQVVILPDNDPPGEQHANQVAASVYGKAASVKLLRLPGLPPKGDVSDWIKAGGTPDQFLALVRTTDEWHPGPGPSRAPANASPAVEIDDEPILVSRDAVQPFPAHVFPDPLRQFIDSAAAALPAPPDFTGVPLLAVLGTAIGTRRNIQVKPRWMEGARIWTAVVADTGTKKSPALDYAREPLDRAQHRFTLAYNQATHDYEAELSRYQEEKKSHPTTRQKPEEPRMSQIYTTDATLESLAELLSENPHGLAFIRDELSGWARSMNQYKGGHGADRQSWLSIWNGSPVIVNRKYRRGPIILENPFVCVTGCIPPDVLDDLADEQGRDDGFLHRILFAYPDTIPFGWSEAVVDAATMETYCDVWRWLHELPDEPAITAFTPDGKTAFVEWAKTHYAAMNAPTLSESLRGPYAKLEGYCARLALILHLSRYVCAEAETEQVDAVSVQGAVELIMYFQSHLSRVYRRLHVSKEDRQMFRIVEWIRCHGGIVSRRDAITARLGGCENETTVDTLFRKLAERGYGTTEPTATRGPKSVRFRLSSC